MKRLIYIFLILLSCLSIGGGAFIVFAYDTTIRWLNTGDGPKRLGARAIAQNDAENVPTAAQVYDFVVSGINVSDAEYAAGWDGVTTIAPSKNAVYDALAGGTTALAVATVDTGQGANELYDMDQDVLTTSSPTFATAKLSGLTDTYIPYHASDATGLSDSPLIRTDAGTVTLYGADPAFVFDGSTASDTDFWMGVTADEGGDDDDKFQIGKGTTKGTTPYVTLDKDGNVGIGTTTPGTKLEINGVMKAGGNYYNVLSHNLNSTPANGIKIKTNIPYSSGTQMPTIIIEGYDFESAKTVGISIVWYIYDGNFVNYRASSWGDATPVIKLANESSLVTIHLAWTPYYGRFGVRAYAQGMSEQASWFNGWTVADEAAGATNQVTVAYSNTFPGTVNFAGGVWNSSGNVGIGTTSPNQKLTIEGTMSLKEQANANADVAAYGQVWVKTATPNELYFTDDAGTDTQVSSHPLDAPSALYINGPGLDWIGKRIQKYLGVIFWQKIDGTIIEEAFEDYNLRCKDIEGHVDLVKRDWNTVQLAKLRAEKLAEVVETEVAAVDAFESVEITEEVQTGTKSEGFAYVVDKDGKVAVTEKTIPIMTKQGTGKFEKRLKAGISFDDKTGKFISKRTLTEAEVDALNLKAPKMPTWMANWLKSK